MCIYVYYNYYIHSYTCLKWWHHQPGILGPLDILLSKDTSISKLIRAGTTEPKRLKPEIFSDRRGSFKVVTAEEGPWSWSDENFIKLSPEKNDQSWYLLSQNSQMILKCVMTGGSQISSPADLRKSRAVVETVLFVNRIWKASPAAVRICLRTERSLKETKKHAMPMHAHATYTQMDRERDASHLKLNFSTFLVCLKMGYPQDPQRLIHGIFPYVPYSNGHKDQPHIQHSSIYHSCRALNRHELSYRESLTVSTCVLKYPWDIDI